MNKFNVIALANTFAIIDIVLHTLFYFWVFFSPSSYVWTMNLFITGLQLSVTSFDISLVHLLLGTVVEAAVFWLLGATIATLYNKLSR